MSESVPSPPATQREKELKLANSQRRIARHRSLLLHWLGRWLRRPKRASVAPLPAVGPNQVAISFAGHATVLVRYADLKIVCDPMLGRWNGRVHREVLPGLSPADLHDVDLILVGHREKDHLHRSTLKKLPRSATVILPRRTAQMVSDLGFARVVELGVGQSVQHRNVDIATLPVRHGSRDTGALSFMIRGDGPSVYYCGGSGYFSGFAEIGKRYAPDIAILPIGGYSPLSFRDRHMTPLDALYALEDLQSRIMIPIRHGAFALSYEKLRDPARWLGDLVRKGDLEEFVVELAPGESRLFVPPHHGSKRRVGEGEASGKRPSPGDSVPSEAPEVDSMELLIVEDSEPLPLTRLDSPSGAEIDPSDSEVAPIAASGRRAS